MPLVGTEALLAQTLQAAFSVEGQSREQVFTAMAKAILDHIVANGQVVVVVGSPGPTTGKIL